MTREEKNQFVDELSGLCSSETNVIYLADTADLDAMKCHGSPQGVSQWWCQATGREEHIA